MRNKNQETIAVKLGRDEMCQTYTKQNNTHKEANLKAIGLDSVLRKELDTDEGDFDMIVCKEVRKVTNVEITGKKGKISFKKAGLSVNAITDAYKELEGSASVEDQANRDSESARRAKANFESEFARRAKAIRSIEHATAEEITRDFPRLAKPQDGDWLTEHSENGQTLTTFINRCKGMNAKPNKHRNVIYIQPMGTVDISGKAGKN